LLDIEPRWRRVRGYHHLPRLQDAISRMLKIKVERVREKKGRKPKVS